MLISTDTSEQWQDPRILSHSKLSIAYIAYDPRREKNDSMAILTNNKIIYSLQPMNRFLGHSNLAHSYSAIAQYLNSSASIPTGTPLSTSLRRFLVGIAQYLNSSASIPTGTPLSTSLRRFLVGIAQYLNSSASIPTGTPLSTSLRRFLVGIAQYLNSSASIPTGTPLSTSLRRFLVGIAQYLNSSVSIPTGTPLSIYLRRFLVGIAELELICIYTNWDFKLTCSLESSFPSSITLSDAFPTERGCSSNLCIIPY